MAGRPIAMDKYKELTLLFQRGVSIKKSARTLCISRNTVKRYWQQMLRNPHLRGAFLAMNEPDLYSWFTIPSVETVDTT